MAGYQMMLGDVAATQGSLAMVKDAIGIMRRDYETAIKQGVMNRDEAQVMTE